MVWDKGKQLQGGKYTIEEVRRRGRFSITYLARNSQGNLVIIKTLDDVLRHQPGFEDLQESFVKEAVQLSSCKHPNIVKLLELPFQEDKLRCLALEYIDGEDLQRRSQNILPEAKALEYIRQIGAALEVVHQNNLVHRDVKPANIMIRGGSSDAVLIDFGLARGFDYKKLSVSADQVAEPGYTPPELYSQTVEIGAYTDIYSLAATLYNLLTGEIPTNAKERLQNNTPLKEPKEWNSKISDKTNSAILRAMEMKCEKRPQSIQVWFDLLGLQPPSVVVDTGGDKLAKIQTRYGILSFWVGVAGFFVAVIAIFTGMFGNEIKERFIKPSPQPTSTSTPNKP